MVLLYHNSNDYVNKIDLTPLPFALETLELRLGGDESGGPGTTIVRPDNAKSQESCCH
jgi:hypothetical protein